MQNNNENQKQQQMYDARPPKRQMAQGKLKGPSNYHNQWNTPLPIFIQSSINQDDESSAPWQSKPTVLCSSPILPHPENLNLNHKTSLYI